MERPEEVQILVITIAYYKIIDTTAHYKMLNFVFVCSLVCF